MGALIWAQLALLTAGAASVEIRAEPGTETWRAAALEAVASDALAESEWIWSGRLSGSTLTYEVRTAPDTAVRARGQIDLARSSRAALARAVAESVRDVRTDDEIEVATAPTRGPPLGGLLVVLLIAALIVSSPLLLFAPAIIGHPIKAFRERRSLRWTATCVSLLALVFVVTARSGVQMPLWLVYGGGGVAWGAFVAANSRVIFPAFSGLGRVEHRDVFRLLGSWARVALLRGVRRLVFYAPFVAGLWLAGAYLDLSTRFVIIVALPVWGLMANFWFLSLVENAAFALDSRLVAGTADEENEWHQAVHAYWHGYVRRLGWVEGAAVAKDVLFLPGEGDQVTLYGGGLTHSRVIIGVELLEFGLAPYGRPHDYEAPREDKLFWSDWHAGLIVPTRAGESVADREARAVAHVAEPGDTEPPMQLGQPPTLAGFVEPSALDQRLTFRPAEDPTWLEWDPGSDYDGTDPGDHDFLFGALVWKLGLAQRHADERQTLALLAAPAVARAAGPIRQVARAIAAPYRALFERPQIELEDAFAAVNFARHHLVQFLAWQTWADDAHVTSRALAPELERQSTEIFAALAADDTTTRDPRAPRTRMRFLASFGGSDSSLAAAKLRRRLPLIAALAAAIALISINVIRAINYHPRYVDKVGATSPPPDQGPTTP